MYYSPLYRIFLTWIWGAPCNVCIHGSYEQGGLVPLLSHPSLVAGFKTILPAHLPQCPVPGVPPKSSRSKQTWAAKRAAWRLTEWLVALFGYYELKCPKSLPDISAALGDWYVSDTQHAYILELYEGLIPFCSVKSDEDFVGNCSAF